MTRSDLLDSPEMLEIGLLVAADPSLAERLLASLVALPHQAPGQHPAETSPADDR